MGAILAGCSSDELMPDQDKPVDRDTNFYVNVTIANPAEQGTRANTNTDAADYENGTPDEQKIHEILFVFYNSSNQYVGNTVVSFNSNNKPTVGDEEIGTPPVTQNPDGSIETVINMTVPVSVAVGSLKPASVMAYVNPTGSTDHQRAFEQTLGLTRTLEQVTPQKNNEGNDTHKGYTMTNSVYYDSEKSTQPQISVAIPEGSLFSTKEAANGAADDKKVIIYVERVVAKVTLKKNAGTVTQDDNKIMDSEENTYTLDFNILGWGLSNLEKGTFLVKNFRNGTDNSANFSTFPGLFTTFSYMNWSEASSAFDTDLASPSWNFPSTDKKDDNWGISGHRSFWSMSPTYFTGATYPSYADEVKDNTVKPALKYLSFDDIYNTTSSKLTANGREVTTSGTTLYTLEHTTQKEVVTNQQKRAVTCALVIGQYSLTKTLKGETTPTPVTTDAFFIRNGINSSGEKVNVIYPNEETLKKAILTANNRIYIKNAEGATSEYSPVPWSGEGSDAHLANFEIKHPDKSVTDGKYTPNRFVALQLKAVPAGTKYYLRDTNGVYKEIAATPATNQVSLTQANTALYAVMNGVEKYQSGYAYFAIPIKHLWWRGNDPTNENKPYKEIGDQDFQAKLGQYGIVRNHLYTINVTGIEGIGTGIGDPSVPIIPNVETDKYFVKTEMRVQRWRVVPSQDVVLKP